ncbi:nicotinamide riboside transporter PnuC [Clostridium lacusfryxellense]|uniref:nicotinamide riboside transporter PnuC n=1 Tax=Clostridium lacusfryxellense TaxID=205328 RepID=UPI001C0C1FEB|nr:nicotinamide riboside transporter PnuC [Clostridium lacusfryxellense]MBU3114014.1 nicotinamide riboside transporter PnuC [Clostridium lacusfryxellense]
MKIKNWNLYEIIWIVIFSMVAIVLTIVWKDTLFGFSVFMTGVLCVILAAKGNIWTYFFGMYNTFGYAYLAFNNGLFGEMGLNLLFFTPMNIVGFIMWRNRMSGSIVQMRGLRSKDKILTAIICVLGSIALGIGLSLIKGQNTPYIDAITDILSIVATFLMVWRYKEQWLLYIVLNIFTIVMWSIRTVNGSPDGAMMIVMWSAYLVNAFYGYYNWNKGAIQSKETISI